jgi:hypothetical protein
LSQASFEPESRLLAALKRMIIFIRYSYWIEDKQMTIDSSRRRAVLAIGSLAVGVTALAARPAQAELDRIVPAGARELPELMERLRNAPRRRDFKSVPMILSHPDFWDCEALGEVMAYRGTRKQVWDNTDVAGPWLNLMRNSINTQVFSFGHKDFLVVSATHGTAHLALFDQFMWDKYDLGSIAGSKYQSNTLAAAKPGSMAFSDKEDPASVFGPAGNTIPALRARGAVFLACHNAIWEIAGKLVASGKNLGRGSHEAMAAELTNHLIEDVVLTPGMVATIPELQQVGFHYAA